MGKHLAPTPKHELNFKKKKTPRGSDPQAVSRRADDGSPSDADGLRDKPEAVSGEPELSLDSILAEVRGRRMGAAPGAEPPGGDEPDEPGPEEAPVQEEASAPKQEPAPEEAPDIVKAPNAEKEAAPEESEAPAAEESEKPAEKETGEPGRGAHVLGEGRASRKRARAGKKEKSAGKAALEKLLASLQGVTFQPGHPLAFLLGSAALLLALRFVPLEGWMIPAAYAVPALLAAAEPAADAICCLRGRDYLCAPLLSCLGAVLLFALGSYVEAVLLLLFTTATKLLEGHLLKSCAEEHAKQLDILPKSATLVTEEGLRRVTPDEVEPGDIILVAAGERIPLDGIITEGITTVDTAAISGQRSPWAVNVGYRVYSGCRNLTSEIKVRVTRPYAQSTVKKLVELAKSAPEFVTGQERSAARFQKLLLLALVVLAAAAAAVIPPLREHWALKQNIVLEHERLLWLRRAAVLLIAARTTAGSFGIPLLYRRALVLAGKDGVFTKGVDSFEALARAETMIFDKTGTITEGRYSVTDVYPVKMSEKQLLTIAATAESVSRHPIAAAIRAASGKIDERILKRIRIKDIPGRGVSALVGDRQVLVGNAALLGENDIKYNIPARPGTAIHVAVDKRYCGYIIVADKVRRRAFDALETLRVNGIQKLVLLTGDVMSVARPVASRLNFDMLRAELKPEDKAKAVRYLVKNRGPRSTIALVGEGSNIGRFMSDADVGISMGSLGSDLALACADLLIMDRDIFKLPRMVALCRRVSRRGWENFYGSVAIQLLIALFGLLGVLSPLAAELMSFAVTLGLLANTRRIR